MRRANQKIQNSPEVFSNVLVCSFYLKRTRIGIARQKPPITDGTNIATLERLWETMLIKMLDQFLEYIFVL